MATRKAAQPTPDGTDRVTIRKLSTGVPVLDEILGGGLPEYSVNIIAGSPNVARPRSRIRSRSQTPLPSGLPSTSRS
jgi:predicted ATP-dependent serine protease